MKKYTAAIILAALIASMTACSNAANSSTISQESTSSAAQAESSAEESAASTAQSAATAETPAASNEAAAADGVDLQAVYDKIIAAQTSADDIIMFPDSTPEIIKGFYPGLDELDLKQMYLYMPPVTGNACEILLLEAADSQTADKAQAICSERVKRAAEDTTYPEVSDVWQRNAKVERSGNLICMIVLPDGCTIPDDVFSL